jgi:hypothetical protein
MNESAYTTKSVDNSGQLDGPRGHRHHKVGNASSQEMLSALRRRRQHGKVVET